jgi:hypothetical protein
MSDFSLVPVDYLPDFSGVSLIPVDHNPFIADGVMQPAQAQPVQPQPAQNQPPRPPQQPATGPDLPNVGAPLIGDGGQFSPGVPWANRAADIASKLAGNAFHGAINLAATPGAIMQPNPYPPGSEEAFWYDDQREQLINKAAPAMAFTMMGGSGLVPVPAGTVLGANRVTRGKETGAALGRTATSGLSQSELGAVSAISDSGAVAAANQLAANRAAGAAFERATEAGLEESTLTFGRQLTIGTESGPPTRVDFLTRDPLTGQIGCIECKASQTAPLTRNQSLAFPQIEQSGGTILGAGEPDFPGGTKISPTAVKIVRGP